MKISKFMCISALCAMSLFTACSSDDDPVPGSSIPAKTYTMGNGLEITVDGATAYGQAVTFTPGQGNAATVTIAGQSLDLSSIIGGAMTASKADSPSGLTVPTASVIPGSVKVDIPVTLEGGKDNATFAGSYTADYCTFSYSGEVSAESMTLDIKDVTLLNTTLAGTYDLKSFDDKYYNICRMEWDSEKGALVELWPGAQMEFPMKAMMAMILGGYDLVEVDGQKMKVFEALEAVLKSVTLGTDGSVTAVYGDTKAAGLPDVTSAKGLVQYVVTSDNQMRLILNPYAIIAASTASKADADEPEQSELDPSVLLPKLMPVAEKLLPRLIPLMSQGIPVCYGPALVSDEDDSDKMVASSDPNFVSFYLDTDFLLPILKDVAPLLEDEDVINFIVAAASKDPEMGSMAGMLPTILKSLPDVIDTTSKIELGLDLQRR